MDTIGNCQRPVCSLGVSQHMPQNLILPLISPRIRELLTLAILELREQAALDTLQKKWWSGNGSSSCKVQKVPEHLVNKKCLLFDFTIEDI